MGFDRRPLEARAFYGMVALATLTGMVISLGAVDPIKALYGSAVVNGVIAVPVMACDDACRGARSDIMGASRCEGGCSARLDRDRVHALAVIAMLATTLLS